MRKQIIEVTEHLGVINNKTITTKMLTQDPHHLNEVSDSKPMDQTNQELSLAAKRVEQVSMAADQSVLQGV